MKLRITASPLLLLAALFIGCGGHGHMRQLERLEAQLDTAPSVVRLALDSIPFASLGDEERALYAILRTQANYKCYVPLTTDTLIRHATNYYNRNRKSYRAAMAWYSLGCVYTELSDDAAAIGAYLRAQTLFPDTTIRYHALCYQNLGRHYLNKAMYDEAMQSFRRFRANATGDDLHYANINIARIHIYKAEYSKGKKILTSFLQQVEDLDSSYLGNIYYELGKIEYADTHNYNAADSLFNLAIEYGDSVLIPLVYFFKGEIANIRDEESVALHSYAQALHNSSDLYLSYSCTRELMYLSLDSTLLPLQNSYVRQFELLYDSISSIERRTEINDIHKEHEMALHKHKIEERTRIIVILAILFAIIMITGISLYMQYRENRQKRLIISLQKRLRNNQAQLQTLLKEVKPDNEASNQHRVQVIKLYHNNLLLGEQLFKKTPFVKDLNQLTNTKDKDFSVMKNAEREQIIQAIFECFAESISNLHTESHGSLNPDEIITCVLSAMHYRFNVIMICTQSQYSTHTSRKTRIKRKLPDDIIPLFFPD